MVPPQPIAGSLATARGAAALVAVAVLALLYADRQTKATQRITTLADNLKTSLAESNRLLAIRNFDRGQAACEKGEIGPGMLWMIESWRSAVDGRRSRLAARRAGQPGRLASALPSAQSGLFSHDARRGRGIQPRWPDRDLRQHRRDGAAVGCSQRQEHRSVATSRRPVPSRSAFSPMARPC